MTHVAIVTPCFNDGATLGESLASALAQTHDDLSVIVVDDGSTDAATLTLLDELTARGDARVTVLHRPNGGSAAARNTAIAAATQATYILPLDADDTIEPTYVAQAAAALDADERVGVVMSRAQAFGLAEGPLDLPDFSVARLLVDNAIWVCSMFRRADWAAVGGYDEHLEFEEDHDF